MGIPKFFRWLTRRYPLILKNIHREEDCPPIDNLYLDLNGIVHNCIHGNDAKLHERVSRLEDFDEVWANIMKAIDEIVHTVKPRKLLFLAVDGVAPRAKMNQQRARRFRSAKDSMMLRDQLLSQGKEAPDLFDSNAISPGTKFMFELNKQLEFFVQYKLNTDPLYQKLEVVLSDSSVPGEGEHKMMDYIRQAKTQETYDPNTRHCFYGADADLIMLSLLTHEPNFMIIREEHVVKKVKQGGVNRLDISKTFNFQLIFISLLREYFEIEYAVLAQQMKMRLDIERIIDDFVFFCFFIGNDFLPSLSALDISEGSLDSLIELYKRHLPQMTDYITEAGTIFWDRAEPFINMLGEHELESFKMRIDSIKHAQMERIVSFEGDFNSMKTEVDRKTVIKNKVRAAINEKKLTKILHLKNKNRDKKQKKFWLLKRFEDEENNEAAYGLSKHQKEIRSQMLNKFRALLDKQKVDENVQSAEEKSEFVEEQKVELLRDVIANIKEEYFSDLNPEDIPDDEVSDVDESLLDLDSIPAMQTSQEISSKIKVQEQIIDKYSEENLIFMTKLISLFSTNPVEAKAFYYKEKLHVDVSSPQGISFKKKMLHKYLEGLQWVLYYYYRGAQHWRWYYPYHYAPMISDIDENIVQNFLSGKVTIDKFVIDENCSEINVPYTPFQQLFSIMPIKSIGLLPSSYGPIAKNELKEYFPLDFDIDLNGRALPWEAACLIPFCDEKIFIDQETQMLASQPLSLEEKTRNQIYFFFKSFKYDPMIKKSQEAIQPLRSSIKSIADIPKNCVAVQLMYDYQDVGKHSFLPKLLPGVQLPCVDFPSIRWLGATNADYDTKVINRVAFQRVLVRVPPAPEDNNSERLEQFVNKFASEANKELFVGSPYQIEAFPVHFEDHKFTYTLYGDVYTNIYKVHKEPQHLTADKFGDFVRRRLWKMQDEGFACAGSTAFVSVNRLKDIQFDSKNHIYYKTYYEDSELLPLAMIMKRRDPTHYLNMNQRCNSLLHSFKQGSLAICMNTQLFGVTGVVQGVDTMKSNVKVCFDREAEESKVHDPFLGITALKDQDLTRELPTKRYYSDSQIEQILKLPRGVINKITSSFLVQFTDPIKFEKSVIDLGLNIKNFVKKQHIPDYVRFVADQDSLAENQFDDYTHNQHARGARHVRKHWEYSQECFETIKEYHQKFSLVFEGLIKAMKVNKQMITLRDMFGRNDLDEYKVSMRLKEAVSWVEKQPLSHQPFVEMGFDALDADLIQMLDKHLYKLRDKFQTVKLKCRDSEFLNPTFLYQENFPFWCQPYSTKNVDDYKVGDRVINVNSTKREYVPFGLRGTVVGHTNDRVIVLFDEQFLGGCNIFSHCKDFKGGYLNPNFIINLTHKFSSLMKKNKEAVESFIEQPKSTDDEESIIMQQAREEAILQTQSQTAEIVRHDSYQSASSNNQQREYNNQMQQQSYQPRDRGGYNNNRGGDKDTRNYQKGNGRGGNYRQSNNNYQGGVAGGVTTTNNAQQPHQEEVANQLPPETSSQVQNNNQEQQKPRTFGRGQRKPNEGGGARQQQQYQPKLQSQHSEEQKVGYSAPHRQVYQVKSQQAVIDAATLTSIIKSASVAIDDEDENAELYQDLSALQNQLQHFNSEMPPQHDPIFAEPPPSLNIDAQAFTPSFQMPPIQADQVVAGQQEEQPGFVPDVNLQMNPDFQNLMSMMNTLASQLMQTPIFTPNNSSSEQEQPPK